MRFLLFLLHVLSFGFSVGVSLARRCAFPLLGQAWAEGKGEFAVCCHHALSGRKPDKMHAAIV